MTDIGQGWTEEWEISRRMDLLEQKLDLFLEGRETRVYPDWKETVPEESCNHLLVADWSNGEWMLTCELCGLSLTKSQETPHPPLTIERLREKVFGAEEHWRLPPTFQRDGENLRYDPWYKPWMQH